MVEKVPLPLNKMYFELNWEENNGNPTMTLLHLMFLQIVCLPVRDDGKNISLSFLGNSLNRTQRTNNVLKIVSFVSKSFQHLVWRVEDSDRIQSCQKVYLFIFYVWWKKCKWAPQKPNVSCTFFAVRGAYQSRLSMDHICNVSAYNGFYEVLYLYSWKKIWNGVTVGWWF